VTDPLNRAGPAKHRWQQIPDRQVFDFAITVGSPNRRAS
jgi:hypothetical protein